MVSFGCCLLAVADQCAISDQTQPYCSHNMVDRFVNVDACTSKHTSKESATVQGQQPVCADGSAACCCDSDGSCHDGDDLWCCKRGDEGVGAHHTPRSGASVSGHDTRTVHRVMSHTPPRVSAHGQRHRGRDGSHMHVSETIIVLTILRDEGTDQGVGAAPRDGAAGSESIHRLNSTLLA